VQNVELLNVKPGGTRSPDLSKWWILAAFS